ncbi:hypothetical protein T492DRAFT_69539 [Pavlovales sp. CCMP2436]|nr:hypothetical protein T492DRAFT_69539 [Pavlovales sp. CCMP2436]
MGAGSGTLRPPRQPPVPAAEPKLSEAESQLVDAASVGYHELLETETPRRRRTDLTCAHCCATLYQPTTLGDGATYCRACVPKLLQNAVGLEVGFGKAINTTLDNLSRVWFPAGHRAAQLRQEGNELFGAGRLDEACAVYTAALSHAVDAVLLCNRSAARLRLGDAQGATRDAVLAARLSAVGSRMWSKALFRLGTALNAQGANPASALATLATLVAVQRAQREPLAQSLGALREAAAAFARAASLAADPNDDCVSMGALLTGLRDMRALARALDAYTHLPQTEAAAVDKELAQALAAAEAAAVVPAQTVDACRDGVECALCVEQLHLPSALPCGHVLCRSCLSRALDQAFDAPARCPLCRHDLGSFLAFINLRAREEVN